LAKAFIIAAPSSGSGKTLVTLGLIKAFRNRGLKVASCKVGPDYIDPGFHAAASGAPCFNLDPWAMGKERCLALFHELQSTHNLVIIEGVMGLFDGPDGAAGSTADLAAMLNLPIILVVDASHQAQSIAALVHGFSSYRADAKVAGVILNRVASDRHAAILTTALAKSSTEIVGIVRRNDSLKWPSRHLGLVQAQENQELTTFIETVALGVARETNLDNLLTIGSCCANQTVKDPAFMAPLGQSIAIARDNAFSFIYPHLLKSWQKSGAELHFFSPLANEPAQKTNAIFLPGGYPELHAGKLASNTTFLESLRANTALIYGECGGYMVLGEQLTDADGVSHSMAGLLPVSTSFATRKLHLGYRQLHAASGPLKGNYRGHEFHYSTIANSQNQDHLFTARDASGQNLALMGHMRGNVMGSYAHIISGFTS
jgi:cobyrinic acid a,c-diamide synthase